ncbi:hypothetical protein BDW02DRAFT_631041 [Decorospora gaudefroyi]|uniref:Telomere-associated protein Rif1 N-terminal domain-containing protein n=1 Tax=Decorospora gaudefroyi TaxID=184978 RepID=A0A6A5K7D5_9PLEO|nr:hypothetical protein BDW02DRAFT_631041 [Decorospora gaudefroyi]
MVLSKFDSLPVRPPTPPKDEEDGGADETLQFLQDPFGEKPIPPRLKAAKTLPNTPEQSSSSDISIPSSSASTRKRVNFELQTCHIPTTKAVATSWTPTRSSPLRPLPQTRITKPLKSILKPSDGTPTPPPADAAAAAAHKFKTFAEMLESIVKQLTSSERSARVDAYHALQRTMQAYDKFPDDEALRQKMSLLTHFIRRDIEAPSPTGTGLDSQLIAQALKLLMALFRIKDLISAMDDDFCAFIVDRVICVASDSSMSKVVVNTHLAVLMQQSFRPKAVTPTRVEKVLDTLDTIHERITGYSVLAYRVRVYRKFIQQRPEVMVKHSERWVRHILKAFGSVQKDITQSALDTALSAAKSIGHDPHVAKAVLSVLNHVKSDGDTIATVLIHQLEQMLAGDNAALVPQIWAAVTGLLKGSFQSQMFSTMREWLGVFEKCLASEKELVKVHVNVAFCFALYSVDLAPDTTEAWTKMFLKIPLHQLQRERKTPMKRSEQDAISSGYFTLLYYALRPAAPFEQLDRYWTEFVVGLWTPLVQSSPNQHAIPACRVVSALLNGSRKPWNEHRALNLQPQLMVQRGELPLVGPKWVRKSITLVLQFVETLLDATIWTENREPEDEPVKTMWLTVVDSLVEASNKEVMASSETKEAMAHIINLLRRIWDRHTAKLALPQKKEDLWADKFCFLIETVVQKLGAFQFADKSLTRNDNDQFEVASTPSHRTRHLSTRISPLLYLIDLLVNKSEGRLADPVRLRAINLIIEPCFEAQNSRLSKLEFLRDCAATVHGSLGGLVASKFWAQIASLLDATIREQVPAIDERVSRPLGKEYELVVEVLRLGSASLLNRPHGHEVLSTLIDIVRREAGEGAVILAVIEKVSECIIQRTSDEDKITCLSYTSILLRNLKKQVSRKVLDQGRQNLWPSNPTTVRNPDFDPYVHLYGAIVSVGSAAYRDLNEDVEPTKEFLTALRVSIHNCSTSHLAVYLRKTQDMIRIWVEDSQKKMQSKDQSLKGLHREVVNLWGEINKAVERLPRKDSQVLLHLEPLITAGFLSKRRTIVNVSIATWNNTFGQEASLRYPSRLEQALRQLRSSAELSLPSLEVRKEDADNKLSFYDSDTSADEAKPAFKSPRVKESPFKISKSRCKSNSRSPAVPTPASRRVPTRQISKVRLRHDNSQIEFEPIVSSPTNPFNQESQILTERQKEMLDRQRLTTGIFAKMGAPSPQPEEVSSPMEIHSDALTADDLPDRACRTTPLKALAAIGSMDAFLGSSPTPHARRSTQKILSDDTIVATPTTARTIQLFPNEDLGSSPPRVGNDNNSKVTLSDSDVLVGSSFQYRQREDSHSMSFDDGTTVDEEALLDAVAQIDGLQPNSDLLTDTIMSELPSSTIDLQLTAQIDADMQTHVVSTNEPTEEAAPASNAEFVDAASHQHQSHVEEQGSQADTSSTSRVHDSFTKTSSVNGTPKAQSLRRSTRNSTGSPVQPPSGKKRKQKAKEEVSEKQTPCQQPVQPDEEGMLDNIIVASPKKPDKTQTQTKKRKSMSNASSNIVPGTKRKLNLRRSQSLLSQVENSQDVLVEDTPAPKRAKQKTGQDVSETRRLSHVQVSPRLPSSSSRRESLVGEPAEPTREPEHTQWRTPVGTPSRSFAERVILTPRSIINQLKSLKDFLFSAPQFVLGREEEREIDDALFDIRRQLHAAGARGEEKKE